MITIVPAIDIIGGQCVRLQQGSYNNVKKYDNDPVKVAENYRHAGLTNLHLVDLDGAKTGQLVNTGVLQEIAERTDLKIDCGGGIKTMGDIEMLLSLGAYAVNLGSVAVQNPTLTSKCLQKYGPEKIILSADVLDDKIMIRGWQQNSGTTIYQIIDQFLTEGLKKICVTAIKCDGMLSGPDLVLYKRLKERYPSLYIIASGGVSSIDDIENLDHAGCQAVIVGKAIYENKITLQQLAKFSQC